jgi:hypothetical protein
MVVQKEEEVAEMGDGVWGEDLQTKPSQVSASSKATVSSSLDTHLIVLITDRQTSTLLMSRELLSGSVLALMIPLSLEPALTGTTTQSSNSQLLTFKAQINQRIL